MIDRDIRATLGPPLNERIYPLFAPPRIVQPKDGLDPAPFGTYLRISGTEETYMDGKVDTLLIARYQIDLFGRDQMYLVETVMVAVKTAMLESPLFKSICLDTNYDFEDPVMLYRIRLDFSIHHNG